MTRTCPPGKIGDQLGHPKISMTQDRYLGRRLTDRLTSSRSCWDSRTRERKVSCDLGGWSAETL